MSGKGSRPRPVDREKYGRNHERIFGRKTCKTCLYADRNVTWCAIVGGYLSEIKPEECRNWRKSND
jgi:hypothetical protein